MPWRCASRRAARLLTRRPPTPPAPRVGAPRWPPPAAPKPLSGPTDARAPRGGAAPARARLPTRRRERAGAGPEGAGPRASRQRPPRGCANRPAARGLGPALRDAAGREAASGWSGSRAHPLAPRAARPRLPRAPRAPGPRVPRRPLHLNPWPQAADALRLPEMQLCSRLPSSWQHPFFPCHQRSSEARSLSRGAHSQPQPYMRLVY